MDWKYPFKAQITSKLTKSEESPKNKFASPAPSRPMNTNNLLDTQTSQLNIDC